MASLPSRLHLFPFRAEDRALLERMMERTGRAQAGWHYAMDYAFVLAHFDPRRHRRILDVGCGPTGNILHAYLEQEHGVQVFGLDRKRLDPLRRAWHRLRGFRGGEAIDWVGDLLKFDRRGWDLVVAVSSLEHNRPEASKACWQHAHRLLAPGGSLLATFSVRPRGESRWNQEVAGMDLSLADVEQVWECRFEGDLEAVVASYSDRWLQARYRERFGRPWSPETGYLAAGVVKPAVS